MFCFLKHLSLVTHSRPRHTRLMAHYTNNNKIFPFFHCYYHPTVDTGTSTHTHFYSHSKHHSPTLLSFIHIIDSLQTTQLAYAKLHPAQGLHKQRAPTDIDWEYIYNVSDHYTSSDDSDRHGYQTSHCQKSLTTAIVVIAHLTDFSKSSYVSPQYNIIAVCNFNGKNFTSLNKNPPVIVVNVWQVFDINSSTSKPSAPGLALYPAA